MIILTEAYYYAYPLNSCDMKVIDHDKKYSGHGHHTCELYTESFLRFQNIIGLVPLQPQYQLAIAHPSGTLPWYFDH